MSNTSLDYHTWQVITAQLESMGERSRLNPLRMKSAIQKMEDNTQVAVQEKQIDVEGGHTGTAGGRVIGRKSQTAAGVEYEKNGK